jgi:tetratricopeptide (TPR) repeat protein
MAAYLGNSGQAFNFLTPGGEVIQSDPRQLDPNFLQSIQSVPGISQQQPVQAIQNNGLQKLTETPEYEQLQSTNPLETLWDQGARQRDPYEGMDRQEYLAAKENEKSGVGPSVDISSQAVKPNVEAGDHFVGNAPAMIPSAMNTPGLMKNPYGMMESGIKQQTKAETDAALAHQNAYKEMLDANQARDAAYIEKQQEINDNLSSEYSKLNQLTDSYNKASAVDPNRIYKNQTTGGKIQASIALILGGLGGALQGTGRNVALDMMNQAIDRDIDAQKADLSKKGSSIQLQGNTIGQLRAQLGDLHSAETAYRKIALDNIEMRLNKDLAGVQGTMAEARGKQALGQIQVQKQMLQQQMQQQVMQKSITQKVSQDGILPKEWYAALPENMREKLVPLNDKEYGVAINEKDATDLREIAASTHSVNQLLDDVLDMSKKGVLDKKFATQSRGQILSKIAAVKNMGRAAFKMGTLDEQAERMLTEMTGDPTSIFSSKAQAQLQTFKETMQQLKDDRFSSGLVGYSRTPTKGK